MKSLRIFMGWVCFCLFIISPLTLSAVQEGGEGQIAKLKESVVSFYVEGEDKVEIARGSGFMIGKELMVTNYHLISKAVKVEGLDYRGKKVKIDGIIAHDKNYDLALLKAKCKGPALKPAGFGGIKFGSELTAIGGNQAGELEVYEGKVINLAEFETGMSTAEPGFSAPDTLSGGPVFDENGQLVGILLFPDGPSKFMLPAEIIGKMATTGASVKFKNNQPVDYFSTYEGAWLAARLFTSLQSTSSKGVKYLQEVLKLKPDFLEAHLMLADVQVKQRSYSAAVGSYQKIIQINPELDSAYMGLGDVFMKMMKWSDAIAPLEKAVELNPENITAYQQIGKAYSEQRIFDKSTAAFEKYLELNPQMPGEVPAMLGAGYFELKQYDKAIASFNRALEITPQDESILEKLAQSYQESGDFENAEIAYTKLTQINPDNAKYFFSLMIRMYDTNGMPDKAAAVAERMIELDPNNADAYYNLGYMYVKQEKWQEAIPHFEKAIEVRPDFDYAFMNLGYCYNQLKQYSKAVEAYKKLTEMMADNSDAWLNLAVNYMSLKKWSLAVDPLQKVIDLRPDYANAYYNLAIAYLNLQRNAEARQLYLKLREIDVNLANRLRNYLR